MTNWTVSDIPYQSGRTVVVTGTSGIGFEDALALAASGASVIIAGRNPEKGAIAVDRIRLSFPEAAVTFELLDLTSLDSVKAFADRLQSTHNSLDLLINNAAVMAPPKRLMTLNGFELQFGTNYLGHFALTGLLLPLLRKGNKPRVINVSSIAARTGTINFDDLQAERSYSSMSVYSQSKLACLMFAIELQRRSDAAGWGIKSLAAHPGISRTDLLPNGAGNWIIPGIVRRYLWFLFQPAAQGALPTLFAATSQQAQGGAYYGPDKLNETRGYPALAKIPPQALDIGDAVKLWRYSEELTGAIFPNSNLFEAQESNDVGGRHP